jgi:hypothetical protein
MMADAPDDRLDGERRGHEEEAASGPQQIRLQRVAGHRGSYRTAATTLRGRRDGPGGQSSDRGGGEARDEDRPATPARTLRAAPPQ